MTAGRIITAASAVALVLGAQSGALAGGRPGGPISPPPPPAPCAGKLVHPNPLNPTATVCLTPGAPLRDFTIKNSAAVVVEAQFMDQTSNNTIMKNLAVGQSETVHFEGNHNVGLSVNETNTLHGGQTVIENCSQTYGPPGPGQVSTTPVIEEVKDVPGGQRCTVTR